MTPDGEQRTLAEAGVLDGEALECVLVRQRIRDAFEGAKARVRCWTLPEWGQS